MENKQLDIIDVVEGDRYYFKKLSKETYIEVDGKEVGEDQEFLGTLVTMSFFCLEMVQESCACNCSELEIITENGEYGLIIISIPTDSDKQFTDCLSVRQCGTTNRLPYDGLMGVECSKLELGTKYKISFNPAYSKDECDVVEIYCYEVEGIETGIAEFDSNGFCFDYDHTYRIKNAHNFFLESSTLIRKVEHKGLIGRNGITYDEVSLLVKVDGHEFYDLVNIFIKLYDGVKFTDCISFRYE